MKDKFENEDRGATKICPFCGSSILLDAVKCRECHQWLNTRLSKQREKSMKEKEQGKPENEEQESGAPEKNSEKYTKCPYCAEEIPKFVYICKHCHENIHNRKARHLAYSLHETERIDVYYKQIWKLIVLSVVTLNFYQLFWTIRNWKFIKDHMKLKVRMYLKVLYLFIPVVGLVSVFHQFKSINFLAQRNEVPRSFSPLMIVLVWSIFLIEGGIFLSFTILGTALNLPMILITSVMGLLSVFPLTIVQETMNAILIDEKPEMKIRKWFSIYEIFLIIICIAAWMLIGLYFTYKK